MTLAKHMILSTTATAVLLGALATASLAHAGGENPYVTDSEGQPVRTENSGCVHSRAWKDSMPTCPEPTLVVEEGKSRIVFAVDDAEFFGFDQVKLSDEVKADLDAVVNSVENVDMIHGITVTGHADQIGPAPYNEQLALHRAQAVKDYLVTKGIPANRVQALSNSSSKPLVSCPGIKNERKLIRCLAPNRRVDIEALLADTVDIANVNLVPPAD